MRSVFVINTKRTIYAMGIGKLRSVDVGSYTIRWVVWGYYMLKEHGRTKGADSRISTSGVISAAVNARKNLQIGAQLIIWGSDLVTDLESITEFCVQTGYKYIEAPQMIRELPASQVCEIMQKYGIHLYAIHIGYPDIEDSDRLNQAIRYLKDAGAELLISSGISAGGSVRAYDESAQALNRTAEKCLDVGIRFYYHTHWWEYKPDNTGCRPIEILIDKTAPSLVVFNLDLCWAQAGGQDPVTAIKQLGHRCNYYHIKDGRFSQSPNVVEWRPLGKGEVDITACIEELGKAGRSCFLVVEQDEPYDSPKKDMKASYEFLLDCIKKL